MRLKAFIDEENCIGCMKCIRICPTDAIVGAKRMLHTVLPDLCTACESCVQVCPTDCISLSIKGKIMTAEKEKQLTEKKQNRLRLFSFSDRVMQINDQPISSELKTSPTDQVPKNELDRKQQIAEMIARVQLKKIQK